MVSHFKKVLTSSIVKKQLMGVTGLLLCGFLLSHMLGNCLMYLGPEAFNTYAYTLTSNKLIYVAEAGLLAIFFTHLGLAIRLTIENNIARPVKYYMKQNSGRGSNFASSTMPYTGLIVLIFIVLHLINFKYGPYYTQAYNNVEMRDLYRVMIEHFASPLNVLWYIFAVLSLGIHVSHGFWSAFQSIGFNHPKYNCILKCTSKAFAIFITLGFSAMPIYCFLQGGH
ncbi:MAG: succinate dehydrogenase cytochrome b subunit [Bacteriovoracaceae bacterium]|jgi:succinate dehydrogenase / fumarate reductase, cytochrome b subunit|nr:succinate dehydrogenase cytochrome b subunit [Bacteriovoracaceae bacterium]